MHRNSGFTLIELLITVVVIAILSAIAYPAYQDQMRKSRRTDAKTALPELANREEQFYAKSMPPHYTATINGSLTMTSLNSTLTGPTGLGWGAGNVTEHGYYDLSVASPGGTNYTITATAKAGSPQADDNNCKTLQLTSAGQKTSTNSSGSASSGCW